MAWLDICVLTLRPLPFQRGSILKPHYARIGIFCYWAPPIAVECSSLEHHFHQYKSRFETPLWMVDHVYLLKGWRIWNRQRQWQKPTKHVNWQGRVISQDFTQIWVCIVVFIVTSEMNDSITKTIKKNEWQCSFAEILPAFSKHLNVDLIE